MAGMGPSYGSGPNAAQRNFALIERARARRNAITLDSPSNMGTIAADPGWDAFFLGLQEQGQAANDAGMRHYIDGSGFGRAGRPSLAAMGRPGDADVVRNWAVNVPAGELTDQRQLRDQSLRAMTAQNDMVDAATNDRQAIDRAVATANTPGVSQFGKPIVQTGDGSYATGTPEPGGPVDRNAVLRQMVPGHLQKPEPPTPAVTFAAPTKAIVNGKPVFVRAGSDGLMYGMDRKPIDPAALQPDSASASSESLVAIMGDNGRPVLVPKSQAVGKMPASSREQGRAVTSGDAGRIAEFDTSLDDLKVLRSTLTETADSTGTTAAIGAAMPAWATDLMGWGTDAKKRQGVIDRVKQVIGKALEGGVLRKEDELKYEKILPTIRDTQDVAVSKLDGLEKALKLRRDRELDAREDAGYDVSRFRARGAPAGGGGPVGGKGADPLGIR